MTPQIYITILGIFAGSATVIIVALVGFIGKDMKGQFKNLADVIFKELAKKQSKEICDLKMAYAEKENKNRKIDIDSVAKIARTRR